MGTNNFARMNASKVYAVCMDYEDMVFDDEGNETEETEMRSCDKEDFESVVDYVEELMQDHRELYVSGGDDEPDRNYRGTAIAQFRKRKDFGDVEVQVILTAMIYSAYYEGANLDWKVGYSTDGDENSLEDLEFYHSEMNAGLKKIQQKNAEKWAEKTTTEMVEKLEAIFDKVSTPLNYLGSFSNGEAIYELAKK